MVDEAKHTPGPWTFQRSPHPIDGEYDFAIHANGIPVIAEVYGRDANGGYPPTEANARLIAAAPDMLSALKEVIRFIDSVGSEHINRVPFVNARAAIAKAEGR